MYYKTLVIAVFLIIATLAGWKLLSDSNGELTSSGIYCSSDGTLTDTMPIQSHRSYCIHSDAAEKIFSANAPRPYSFVIIDDRGEALKDFEVTHTKIMHVIVVRKDLASFQHLHPEYDPGIGRFMLTNIAFPSDGPYRIFADFVPAGSQMESDGMPLGVTISEDVAVGNVGNYRPQLLGSEERTKIFNGTHVMLSTMPHTPVAGAESMITFSLSRNSRPVTDLKEYLGALGHSVILREGTLDFLHTHPMEDGSADQDGRVAFMVFFSEAGKYKIFTQFQRAGKVFTTDFVVSVGAGEGEMIPMHEIMQQDH